MEDSFRRNLICGIVFNCLGLIFYQIGIVLFPLAIFNYSKSLILSKYEKNLGGIKFGIINSYFLMIFFITILFIKYNDLNIDDDNGIGILFGIATVALIFSYINIETIKDSNQYKQNKLDFIETNNVDVTPTKDEQIEIVKNDRLEDFDFSETQKVYLDTDSLRIKIAEAIINIANSTSDENYRLIIDQSLTFNETVYMTIDILKQYINYNLTEFGNYYFKKKMQIVYDMLVKHNFVDSGEEMSIKLLPVYEKLFKATYIKYKENIIKAEKSLKFLLVKNGFTSDDDNIEDLILCLEKYDKVILQLLNCMSYYCLAIYSAFKEDNFNKNIEDVYKLAEKEGIENSNSFNTKDMFDSMLSEMKRILIIDND